MNKTPIETYKPTGEFCATLDFGKKEVDWNTVHKQLHSGCHCIWVKSDLEAYVTIYGWEENCVRDRLNVLETYLNLIKGDKE